MFILHISVCLPQESYHLPTLEGQQTSNGSTEDSYHSASALSLPSELDPCNLFPLVKDPCYRFEGVSPTPCREVQFPVFVKRFRVVPTDPDDVARVIRITTDRVYQPVFDYNVVTLSDAGWLDKVTSDYVVSDKFKSEGARFFAYRDGDASLVSLVVRVDLNHLCDEFPFWGFHEWRVLHDSKYMCLCYSLQDVMNCLGYSSRKSSQSILNDLCHRMPMEIKVRLLKVKWNSDGGHPSYFGDIFVVRTLLSMITFCHRPKKDEKTVKGLFTVEMLESVCERIVMARLSIP